MKFVSYFFGLLLITSFASCDDWTDIESSDIEQTHVSKTNPGLYAEYLENLRAYKKNEHKLVYVTFDNSEKKPFTKAQHISTIPDSVDVVALKFPRDLASWEFQEMDNVRNNKGTKFIFTIDFEAMKVAYGKKVAKLEEEKKEGDASVITTFASYMTKQIREDILSLTKYGYDGICFSYNGKRILHMTDKEKTEYKHYHNIFVGILKDWRSRNEDKLFFFQGKPQNLMDRSFLKNCHSIILPCKHAGNAAKLVYEIISASAEDVPTDRFMVGVETTSLDAADVKTGLWSDGSRAIEGASIWTASDHNGYSITGLVIYNVSNDYYSQGLLYKYTRGAINNINPSIKN